MRTHRSAVCSVLLSLLFSKQTHAIFIVIIASSDYALPLALLLTLEDCIPHKHSTYFLEGQLREQTAHKEVKYQSFPLKVNLKSIKLFFFPVQLHQCPSLDLELHLKSILVILTYQILVQLPEQSECAN